MKTINKKMILAGLLAVAALAPKEAMADCWFLPALVAVQEAILKAHGRFLAVVKMLQTTDRLWDWAPSTVSMPELAPSFNACRDEALYGKNEDLKPAITFCEGCSHPCDAFTKFNNLVKSTAYSKASPESTNSLIAENAALLKQLNEKKKE